MFVELCPENTRQQTKPSSLLASIIPTLIVRCASHGHNLTEHGPCRICHLNTVPTDEEQRQGINRLYANTCLACVGTGWALGGNVYTGFTVCLACGGCGSEDAPQLSDMAPSHPHSTLNAARIA